MLGTIYTEVDPAVGSDNDIPTRPGGLRRERHVFLQALYARHFRGITRRRPQAPTEVRPSLKRRQAPGQYEAVTSVVASQEQKHGAENPRLPPLRTD